MFDLSTMWNNANLFLESAWYRLTGSGPLTAGAQQVTTAEDEMYGPPVPSMPKGTGTLGRKNRAGVPPLLIVGLIGLAIYLGTRKK
jgi:hypothetical protein